MDPTTASRVTVITVAYNSSRILGTLLGSIPEGVACIVVDNASQDAEASRALAEAHGARFIGNAENIGFGRACNQGAAAAEGDLLFFVNPDAELTPGAIPTLLAAADAHPQASGFNPRVTKGDGSVYFKRRSKLIPRAQWLGRDAASRDGDLPVLSGGAMLVRKACFDRVGGFDPKIFLFHEDDDLSLRLRDQCGPLRYVYDAEVRHLLGHGSERSVRTAALKAWYMGQSRVYAARKHGQRFAFARALGEAVLQLISPLTLLSARKRAKHWHYLKAVLASRSQTDATRPPSRLP